MGVMGLVLEVIGYIGRILLHNDPFNDDNFLMYLVTLTIAPALLSASIYLFSHASSTCTARTSHASSLVHIHSSSSLATSFVSFFKHSVVVSPVQQMTRVEVILGGIS